MTTKSEEQSLKNYNTRRHGLQGAFRKRTVHHMLIEHIGLDRAIGSSIEDAEVNADSIEQLIRRLQQ